MHTPVTLADYGVEKIEKTLANGLRVVFVRKPFAPIHCEFAMRAGSVYDPIGKEGLAHFSEHLLVSGSQEYPKAEFAKIINAVGGYSNAYTNQIMMSVVCEVALPQHMERVAKHFMNSVGGYHITPEKVEKEKGTITSEIERYASNNDVRYSWFVRDIVGGQSRFAHEILGTVESISKFTAEDVETFLKESIVAENVVLVVAGGCEMADIERAFGSLPLPHGAERQLPADPVPVEAGLRSHFDIDIPQTNITVMFAAPDVESREFDILTFAIAFAHDGFASLFYRRIRNEKNLAYAVANTTVAFNDRAYVGTWTGVPTERVEEALAEITACYEELLRDGMTAQQLEYQLNLMQFRSIRTKQEVEDWVNVFVDTKLYPEQHPRFGEFPDKLNYLRTVTAEEVLAVLKKWIIPQNMIILTGGK
jgi:predicted Zn-dependent peptidase